MDTTPKSITGMRYQLLWFWVSLTFGISLYVYDRPSLIVVIKLCDYFVCGCFCPGFLMFLSDINKIKGLPITGTNRLQVGVLCILHTHSVFVIGESTRAHQCRPNRKQDGSTSPDLLYWGLVGESSVS